MNDFIVNKLQNCIYHENDNMISYTERDSKFEFSSA
jgi:hypothetical protein